MTVNNKRVFYVKYLAHEIYTEILKARPDVRLDRLENESPDAVAAPILAAAHAYQIGAARDELAPHFHVHKDLLKRTPNLLIVSSNGAGFDPVDVDACTAAGVLVVNQSGGNANSVAEHALGMLITLSKRILESDRALRRDRNVNRNALIGNEAKGKTIGVIGLGNVGRRIAALDSGSRGMIGAQQFALMQPHAFFITTARGFIHDERALYDALKEKRIAGAGLDVWDKEPPSPDPPLLP